MNCRRYNRRKRIVIAYALRAIVLVLAAGAITLMVCGGLYLFELFQSDEKTQAFGRNEAVYLLETGNISTENERENTQSDGRNEVTDNYTSEEEGSVLTIVLDAGHGGNDGGTFQGKVVEKNITLFVVGYMQQFLEEEGWDVVLTREKDAYVPLEERTYIGNHSDADLFVSIHCNYFEDDSAVSGLECYYCEGSTEGQKYAEHIIDALASSGEINVREAKESDFYVLTQTDIPAVLVEMGFLSNAAECKKLASEEYQRKLAEEMVKGIVDAAISSR